MGGKSDDIEGMCDFTMTSIIEKPIYREGKLIGYRQYTPNGIFGNSFVGYRWFTPEEMTIGTRTMGQIRADKEKRWYPKKKVLKAPKRTSIESYYKKKNTLPKKGIVGNASRRFR